MYLDFPKDLDLSVFMVQAEQEGDPEENDKKIEVEEI